MAEDSAVPEVELVYPIYLDVPMMTSFVAALEDGIAYGSDVVRWEDQRQSSGKEATAGVGIPRVSILSSLFNFDLRGKITGAGEAGSGEEVTLVRRHTEASLFMRLRQSLIERQLVSTVTSVDDLEQLSQAKQGSLVEIAGQIYRSPLSETLEAVFRILNMLGVEISEDSSPQPATQNNQGQKKGGQNKRQNQVQSAPQVGGVELGEDSLFGLRIAQRVKDDLQESKILDAILRPSDVEGLTVVLSLALDALPEGALDNVLSGRFTVLGKVTRIVEGEEEISLYQRSALRYFMDNSEFESAFTSIGQGFGLNIADNPSSVGAPAVQLMPLAIYA